MDIGVTDEQPFVTLITYVVVDQNDPGFRNPAKQIGPFYPEDEAAGLPYNMVKTDRGYRRVVASPKPLHIVERRRHLGPCAAGFFLLTNSDFSRIK
jgi:carbamate kinase